MENAWSNVCQTVPWGYFVGGWGTGDGMKFEFVLPACYPFVSWKIKAESFKKNLREIDL